MASGLVLAGAVGIIWSAPSTTVAEPAPLIALAAPTIVAGAAGGSATGRASSTPSPIPPATPRSVGTSRSPRTPSAASPTPRASSTRASSTPTASRKPSATPSPKPKVIGKRYAKVALNVRVEPEQDADVVAEVKPGAKVEVTDQVEDGYRFIAYDDHGRWVKDKFLLTEPPSPADLAFSGASCASGSSVERGLKPDTIRLHRALCARYPSIRSYGGVRADSLPAHPSGRALDSMTSDSVLGWQIANWVRANHTRLGVSEVLYAQHIWTVQRGSDGWRKFSSRGSKTANHYDHVHVTVYGDRGTG